MTSIRRALLMAGLVLSLVVAASSPASAEFSDATHIPAMTVATGTVQAAGSLALNDYCVTTTTTTRKTVFTDPVTGVRTTTGNSSSATTATSSTNVQSTTTSTASGPGVNETTTTTVSKNTNLHVTLSWTASTSPRVTGYAISAYLGVDGTSLQLMTTTGTSVSQVQDADNLYYQPRLFVTTQTAYGWTADSTRTATLSC